MGKKGAAASSSSDGGSGGKDKLGTCKEVNARHILCEKQGKILEVQQKLKEGWLDNGNKVPISEFGYVLLYLLFECYEFNFKNIIEN